MAEASPTPVVRAHVVGVTDVGKVREHNEDNFLVLDLDVRKPLASGERYDGDLRTGMLLVVCDGMGGAAAGEVASKMAAGRISEVVSKADLSAATPDQISSLMDQAVQQANTEIFEKSKGNAEMKGMGTTLTAAVVTPGRIFVSQVGDSRAYLYRKGLLNQITKDQSLIGQLIEEGTLTEEEAEKLGGRNIVLQAVGVEETLRVDTKYWPLLRGDLILLCSDGLTGMVKDARIREVLTEKGEDLKAAAAQLIAEANAAGGRDNITVILARFDGDGLRPPMETESAGGVEAAGASFKAPPPPEVPNPMKKVAIGGAALLVAIAAVFLIFRPTKANVSVSVKPAGAKVRLLDRKGGPVVLERTASAGPVEFAGVEPREEEYWLEVSSEPTHYTFEVAVPIKEHGVVALDGVLAKMLNQPWEGIWLEPKHGTVTVRAADPDVKATFHVTPAHPRGTDPKLDLALERAGESRTTKDVSAGEWKLVASRPGFRTREIAGTLDADETEEISIPPLEEVRGTLAVEGSAGGRIEVRTAAGDALFEGDAAGDAWEQQVRAVKVRVRVTWKGYRPFEADADVPEGGRAVVKVKREAEKVRVTISGPANRVFAVEVQEGGRWRQVSEGVIDAAGAAPPVNLAPGRYRARFDDGSGSAEFEVAPGSAEVRVRLEGR